MICRTGGGGEMSSSQMIEVAMLEEEDMDNEVSVADLPLPDVVSDISSGIEAPAAGHGLDDSDVDDSEDNDTLTSKSSSKHHHHTDSNNVSESGRLTSVDDNDNDPLRKNCIDSDSVQGFTDQGGGGDGNSKADSSSVDPDETTEPIEI